jgi:ubiquinone/menaquinone biosynthesis C-methylase UbiE
MKGKIMNEKSDKQIINQMLVGAWITQGIYVAAELCIADLIVDGPKTAKELASQTATNYEALYRVLRALASVGIFSEDSDSRFSMTPMAEYLRSDHPDSSRALAIMSGAEIYTAWGQLLGSVQTGKEAMQETFGRKFFQYMTEHPERHRIYDAAMTGIHDAETQPMLDAYDFSGFASIVDIGGGNGSLLAAILKKHSNCRGVLFDLPEVADTAHSVIDNYGLSDRCDIVGGNFFDSLPPDCDAYLMRHVVHDWQDKEAITILSNCRKVMKPGGRILLVETVIPSLNEPCFGKWLDLMMLLVGGRERTEEQYRRLLSAAGLRVSRIVPTTHEVSVIEAVVAV